MLRLEVGNYSWIGSGSDLVICILITDQVATAPCTDPIQVQSYIEASYPPGGTDSFTTSATFPRSISRCSPLLIFLIATSPFACSSSPITATNGTPNADAYLNCLPSLSA